MPTLYLIRHGQTTSNEIAALDTALPGAGLTEWGREQSTDAGTLLSRLAPCLRVLSSEAARAQQTAVNLATSYVAGGGELLYSTDLPGAHPLDDATALNLAASYRTAPEGFDPGDPVACQELDRGVLGVDVSPRLAALPDVSEVLAGDWEMHRDEEAHRGYNTVLAKWMTGEYDLRMPGGETGETVLRKYLARLLPVLVAASNGCERGEGSDIAVVSHGAVIRLVACFLAKTDPSWAITAYLANTHMVEFDIPDDLEQRVREVCGFAATGLPLPEALASGEWGLSSLAGICPVREWGLHGTPPGYPGGGEAEHQLSLLD